MVDPTASSDALPDSGDGVERPAADALPAPALWAGSRPKRQPAAWRGQKEDDADIPPRTPARQLTIYASVAGMVLATVLVGIAFVLPSLTLGAVGVVLGLVSLVVALKAKVLLAVSVGQSPTGPG